MYLVVSWVAVWALCIGALGSCAYFAAVYFGFVGESASRDVLLKYFRREGESYLLGLEDLITKPNTSERHSWFRIGAFALIGGLIAVVFQLPEDSFVPVQSFILGATWPAVVAQHVSGRQTGPTRREATQSVAAKTRLTELPRLADSATEEIDRATQEARAALEEAIRDAQVTIEPETEEQAPRNEAQADTAEGQSQGTGSQ